MLSVDIIPVPTDEAVREVENRLLGVETNITNWQRKQNQNNNFSAVIPYDLEQQRKESKEFLDDLTTRDQRMMFAVLTMVHTADTKEQLDNDTEALLTTARKHLCQFAVLKYQQMDGLNTALTIWCTEDRCPAYPHNREPCSVYPVPSAGNLPRKWCVLRSECHQQKYDYRQPQAAP